MKDTQVGAHFWSIGYTLTDLQRALRQMTNRVARARGNEGADCGPDR